jgi:hypothetical protein
MYIFDDHSAGKYELYQQKLNIINLKQQNNNLSSGKEIR